MNFYYSAISGFLMIFIFAVLRHWKKIYHSLFCHFICEKSKYWINFFFGISSFLNILFSVFSQVEVLSNIEFTLWGKNLNSLKYKNLFVWPNRHLSEFWSDQTNFKFKSNCTNQDDNRGFMYELKFPSKHKMMLT